MVQYPNRLFETNALNITNVCVGACCLLAVALQALWTLWHCWTARARGLRWYGLLHGHAQSWDEGLEPFVQSPQCILCCSTTGVFVKLQMLSILHCDLLHFQLATAICGNEVGQIWALSILIAERSIMQCAKATARLELFAKHL